MSYYPTNEPKRKYVGRNKERTGSCGEVVYLPKNKAHLFVTMIDKIAKYNGGGIMKAVASLHLGDNTYYKMKDDRLVSPDVAQRILNAFQRLPKKVDDDG